MANITDPKAIRLSNEIGRVGGDKLVNLYYYLKRLNDEWVAAGNDAAAISTMLPKINRAADKLKAMYEWCFSQSNTLTAIGATDLNTLLPRDTSPVIDGAPADGRLAITGQDVRRVFDRIDWFEGWLRLDAATGLVSDWVRLRQCLLATTVAERTLTLGQARNVTIDRPTELKTEFEATSSQKLGWLLKLAVNPRTSEAL